MCVRARAKEIVIWGGKRRAESRSKWAGAAAGMGREQQAARVRKSGGAAHAQTRLAAETARALDPS